VILVHFSTVYSNSLMFIDGRIDQTDLEISEGFVTNTNKVVKTEGGSQERYSVHSGTRSPCCDVPKGCNNGYGSSLAVCFPHTHNSLSHIRFQPTRN
jgi:hypothetical protein